MSDILLIGLNPESEEGREYFVYCTDYWYDMLEVITNLTAQAVPTDDYLFQDTWLAPPTPHLDDSKAKRLSSEVKRVVGSGKAQRLLEHFYRTDPLCITHFAGDAATIADTVAERMTDLKNFSRFLEACGGCKAKWYSEGEWL